jgi:DNA polymerase III subunit delta'
MTVNSGAEKSELFWGICGHEKIVGYLKSAILNDNLHHAYIFSGQKGLGKKFIAEKFVKSLFCSGQGEYRPCEECANCRQINSQVYPDIYYLRRLIDDKTGKLKREIAVEQVRELKVKLSQGSLMSSWRIAIIEEAEYLNQKSSNALLKVLEEPGKKTLLILLVNDHSRVLKTIDSRCQTLNFLPVATEKIKEFLGTKKVSEDKADKLAKLSVGRPGRAIRLLENNDFFTEVKTDVDNFFKVIGSDFNQRLSLINELIDWQKDESLNILRLLRLLDNWLLALRDVLLDTAQAGYYSTGSCRSNQEMCARLPAGEILRINNLFETERANLRYNINSKNILENLIINI